MLAHITIPFLISLEMQKPVDQSIVYMWNVYCHSVILRFFLHTENKEDNTTDYGFKILQKLPENKEETEACRLRLRTIPLI